MLIHHGDVNAQDQDDRSPLMWASSSDAPLAIVSLLHDHHANVNAQDASG
jgi:ankyrin repeat protein